MLTFHVFCWEIEAEYHGNFKCCWEDAFDTHLSIKRVFCQQDADSLCLLLPLVLLPLLACCG